VNREFSGLKIAAQEFFSKKFQKGPVIFAAGNSLENILKIFLLQVLFDREIYFSLNET
jgi:hypothetical protein